MTDTWTPSSWTAFSAGQQPEWPDEAALKEVLEELRVLPPLVFAGEARALKAALGRVSRGEAFLLLAGDCAVAFGDFTADSI
ncbi:MAG: 3-deoxy-7-phosphoheptulonate synthase, partial [Actinomycetota bacterium]|nr:3-deoxy-7-phosphoheptulonate synthase [Actinomycetota bacterium]